MSKQKTKPSLFDPGPGHGIPNTILNWHGSPGKEFAFYGRSFHRAARTLVENWDLDSGSPHADFDACPVVFLYRHAVELYLKAILLGRGANFLPTKPSPSFVTRDHSLTRLLPMIEQILRAVGWTEGLDCGTVKNFEDLRTLIGQLEAVDPASFAFRYPTTKAFDASVTPHFTFMAIEFANRMEDVIAALEYMESALSNAWSVLEDQFSNSENED